MMRAIGLVALLAVLDVGAAFAQTGTSPGQTITGGIPDAPIGHRQPRASDVPDEKNWQNTDPNDPLLKENRALDRTIKSICRGCENVPAQQAVRGKNKKGRRKAGP